MRPCDRYYWECWPVSEAAPYCWHETPEYADTLRNRLDVIRDQMGYLGRALLRVVLWWKR